jgi:2-polyprenyl-6-hydroxyphenyl methylase/3-demethylubiquinone-9 3-methyltransferase
MIDKPSGAYYSDGLNAERLRRCYEIAPPRVQRYLRAEIDFVLACIRPADQVLELGCGYGRAIEHMIGVADRVVGIDTSVDSLIMGAETIECRGLAAMDAGNLGFVDGSFDVVFCIQNGISAFGIDRSLVIDEAIRVTRPGGTVLFSSYSNRFWPERMKWFRIQAAHGLLGDIDEDATGDGVIVCKDGFRAETVGSGQFERLAASTRYPFEVVEVDESSLFCVITRA